MSGDITTGFPLTDCVRPREKLVGLTAPCRTWVERVELVQFCRILRSILLSIAHTVGDSLQPNLLKASLKNPPCMLNTGTVGASCSTQLLSAASFFAEAECSSKRLNHNQGPAGLHSKMFLISVADSFASGIGLNLRYEESGTWQHGGGGGVWGFAKARRFPRPRLPNVQLTHRDMEF